MLVACLGRLKVQLPKGIGPLAAPGLRRGPRGLAVAVLFCLVAALFPAMASAHDPAPTKESYEVEVEKTREVDVYGFVPKEFAVNKTREVPVYSWVTEKVRVSPYWESYTYHPPCEPIVIFGEVATYCPPGEKHWRQVYNYKNVTKRVQTGTRTETYVVYETQMSWEKTGTKQVKKQTGTRTETYVVYETQMSWEKTGTKTETYTDTETRYRDVCPTGHTLKGGTCEHPRTTTPDPTPDPTPGPTPTVSPTPDPGDGDGGDGRGHDDDPGNPNDDTDTDTDTDTGPTCPAGPEKRTVTFGGQTVEYCHRDKCPAGTTPREDTQDGTTTRRCVAPARNCNDGEYPYPVRMWIADTRDGQVHITEEMVADDPAVAAFGEFAAWQASGQCWKPVQQGQGQDLADFYPQPPKENPWDAFGETFKNAFDAGKTIVQAIADGIDAADKWLYNNVCKEDYISDVLTGTGAATEIAARKGLLDSAKGAVVKAGGRAAVITGVSLWGACKLTDIYIDLTGNDPYSTGDSSNTQAEDGDGDSSETQTTPPPSPTPAPTPAGVLSGVKIEGAPAFNSYKNETYVKVVWVWTGANPKGFQVRAQRSGATETLVSLEHTDRDEWVLLPSGGTGDYTIGVRSVESYVTDTYGDWSEITHKAE